LVPRVNTILQDLLDYVKKSSFATASLRKLEIKKLYKFRWFVMLDQGCPGASVWSGEAVTCVLYSSFLIRSSNEWNDEPLN
jgi:hypothetical protein